MTSVGTSFLQPQPHDFSRNLSEEMPKELQKSYQLMFSMSNPGSRSQKFQTSPCDTAHDQILSPVDNESTSGPSSSTSVTRSMVNPSVVETQIATTRDTADNNPSKDLRTSSSTIRVRAEALNNQEETLVCQMCRADFRATATTTNQDFLLGDKYCNACQKKIEDAEPSSDSGRRFKEEEERSSPPLKKQKQETTDKKKKGKKWYRF